MTGGQAVVAALEAAGVDTVFGIPGVHNLDVYDALAESAIRSVHVRHEEGAAFMADGYARASGRPGVALTITGPGATNALTGIGTAYSDSSPVLLLTAQLARPLIDQERGDLHDIRDQPGIFRTLTAWTARASTVREIPTLIHRAMATFRSARPRPIHVEVPLDVLAETDDVEIGPVPAAAPPAPRPEEVAAAAVRLAGAGRVAILAGGGVNAAGATPALVRVAEILQAPVLHTAMGMGAFPDDHPLALGTGWDLEYTMGRVLAEADALLAVGCRFAGLTTRQWTLRVPPTVVQIDIDPREIGKNYPATGVVADARLGLLALAEALEAAGVRRPPADPELQRARAARWAALRARYPAEIGILEDLGAVLGRDGTLVADMTGVGYWARRTWRAPRPRSFLFPMGFGTLGFALPAAIGARLAEPARRLVCVAGDGGYLFTGQELATAVHHGVAFPCVIFNDGSFGAIRHFQKRRFGREVNAELTNPDFVRLAEAYGARGVRLDRLGDLRGALTEALAADRMTIIEAPGDMAHPDAVPLPQY
jgi:acetolactate synthase-1/2/3 large subunit